MFKKRLKKWGLNNKNIKGEETLRVASQRYQRDAFQKPSKIIVRGREREWEHVLRHLNRNPHLRAKLRSNVPDITRENLDVVVRTPSPAPPAVVSVPLVLGTNDTLQVTEELGRRLSDYVTGAFESGLWVVERSDPCEDVRVARRADRWADLGIVAMHLIASGNIQGGFTMIGKWLDRAGRVIREGHPRLLRQTINIVLELMDFQAGDLEVRLRRSVVDYLRDISETVLGPQHPFTIVWKRLRDKPRRALLSIAILAFQPMLDAFEHALGPANLFLIENRRFHLNWQYSNKAIEKDGYVARLQRLLHTENCNTVPHLQVKLDLARALAQSGQLRAAENMLQDASQSHLLRGGQLRYAWATWYFKEARVHVYEATRRSHEAEQACVELVQFSEVAFGYSNDCTIDAMRLRCQILVELKRFAEVSAVSADIAQRSENVSTRE